MSRQALFNLALKAFLLLSPVFFFRGYHPSFARGLFFVFGSFVLFAISMAKEPIRKFSNPWVGLLLLWALIRVFVGGSFGNAGQEWFNFWFSSAGFIYVLAGALLFYAVYCHADSPKNYLTPILVVCGMNFVLAAAQLLGHDFMWAKTPSLCGFFGVSSQLGQYSAMAIPITAFVSPWLAAVPLFSLFAAKSISSILATSVGVGVFLYIKRCRWFYWAGLGVIVSLLVIFNFGLIKAKFHCRPIMWEKTLKVALKRPYLGHGYQSFTKEVVQPDAEVLVGAREFNRAHNDILHTTQELGVPAIIIIGGFFIALWKKFKAKENKSRLAYFLMMSIIIVLVNSCGQTLFRYASVAGAFIILLAFLEIELQGGT